MTILYVLIIIFIIDLVIFTGLNNRHPIVGFLKYSCLMYSLLGQIVDLQYSSEALYVSLMLVFCLNNKYIFKSIFLNIFTIFLIKFFISTNLSFSVEVFLMASLILGISFRSIRLSSLYAIVFVLIMSASLVDALLLYGVFIYCLLYPKIKLVSPIAIHLKQLTILPIMGLLFFEPLVMLKVPMVYTAYLLIVTSLIYQNLKSFKGIDVKV
jgi:hypothetical protein